MATSMPPDTRPAHSPIPRRIATPRWLDLRLVIGVVLVLASVLIGARVVSGSGKTYGVVAVNRDLAAGKVLTSGDLHMAQVRLPDHGSGVYLSDLHTAVGKQLQRDESAGELLAADAIAAGSPRTTLTVPFDAGAAPDLHTGDRVEIWLSTPTCPSLVLLPEVTVQSVSKDTSGSFGSGGDGQDVVVSIAPALAGRVASALAIDQVQLRAGILLGRPTASDTTAASLPDFSTCSAPKK